MCYSKRLKEKLLREDKLTLDKCVELGRTTELAKRQASEMSKEYETLEEKVNHVQIDRKRYQRKDKRDTHQSNSHKKSVKLCYRCGESFTNGHNEQCKANDKTCYNFNRKNHFSSCCKTSKSSSNRSHVRAVNQDSDISESSETKSKDVSALVNSLSKNPKTKSVFVKIEGVNVPMIIDSGSSVNIIDLETFRTVQKNVPKALNVKVSKAKIFPYASKPINTRGYFITSIESERKFSIQKVYVVNKERAGNLLGIAAANELNLIKFETPSIENVNRTECQTKKNKQLRDEKHDDLSKLLEEYSDIFQGHGKLKDCEVKLCVNKDVQPVVQKLCRQPHLRESIKQELHRLESEDIIEKVSGPRPWVSNLVPVPKKNGKVRLCLDARVINTAILREHYPIPTLDSIIDHMHGAKVFAKLDLKEAYTQLVLHEDSRDITCFNSENGIYRQKRLVYGINNAFEIFQGYMEQSYGHINGVKFIGDDIIIYAKDDNKLLQSMREAFDKMRKLGLKLNQQKCVF